jgi:hypothetical protein
LFFLLPLSLALLYPISFWLGNDYEPLGLANAFNLAFRLGHHHMYPGDGMTNHPGVPFYVMSWSALALAGYPLASEPLKFFHAVLDHIRTYQLNTIALASLVGAGSIYVFARVVSPLVGAPTVVLGLALWLLSTPATIINFVSPSNETFALTVNVLFLLSLLRISRDDRGTFGTFAIAGAVGAIAYLNKMFYIYVPAALCAAMFVQYALPAKHALRLLRGIAISSLVLVAFVAAVGYFVIGWNGFRALLSFHQSVILGSGLYGEGPHTVVSPDHVLNALSSIPSDRAYAIPLALLGGVGLLLIAGILFLRNRRPHPEITIAVGCGLAAVLSALFVLKHYSANYSAGVSATLPGCLVAYHLLVKNRISWITPLVATAALLSMTYPVALRLHPFLKDRAERSQVIALDHDEILKLAANHKGVVDFTYRVPFREYGEGFVLAYTGVEPLTKAYVSDRRGTTNSHTRALVSEDVGAYVLNKDSFPTPDAVKTAPNMDLLGPTPVRFQDGDTLIELRTVYVVLRADH